MERVYTHSKLDICDYLIACHCDRVEVERGLIFSKVDTENMFV